MHEYWMNYHAKNIFQSELKHFMVKYYNNNNNNEYLERLTQIL